MTEPRRFATAAFCIIEDSKLLLVCSRGKQAYYLPGGKIEPGESLVDAVCRELTEELSVTLVPETLVLYGSFEAQAYGEPSGVLVTLNCFTGTYTGKIARSHEIEALKYVTYEEYVSLPETAPAVVLLMKSLQTDGFIL